MSFQSVLARLTDMAFTNDIHSHHSSLIVHHYSSREKLPRLSAAAAAAAAAAAPAAARVALPVPCSAESRFSIHDESAEALPLPPYLTRSVEAATQGQPQCARVLRAGTCGGRREVRNAAGTSGGSASERTGATLLLGYVQGDEKQDFGRR